jgi:hypothetical protein
MAGLDHIRFFIDETIVGHRTGKIQAVVPVPATYYDKVVVPECRKLLSQIGSNAREFHGGKLKPTKQRTCRFYRKFLELFRNLSANVAVRTPLRCVITLDGTSLGTGPTFTSVKYHICHALEKVGISDCECMASEFSRQLVWLKDHFDAIAVRTFPNPLVLTFDNQYRYSSEMQRRRAVVCSDNKTRYMRLEDVFTIAANCLLDQWHSSVKVPRIHRMSFRDSRTEFGLQAADLFSHLYFNYVLAKLGDDRETTRFKADLLQELLPSLKMTSMDLAGMSLISVNGQKSFDLNTPYFGQQAILGPPAAD